MFENRADKALFLIKEGYNAQEIVKRGRYFIVGKNYPSIDHIVPLSWGGLHSWANVQLAHHGCNTAKGAKYCG